MAKADWGEKRECAGCGARYYDLGKNPPQCPSCGAEYRPPTRAGGARAAAPAEAKPAPVAKPKAAAPDDELVADDDDDDDDDDLLEDDDEEDDPEAVLDVKEDDEK